MGIIIPFFAILIVKKYHAKKLFSIATGIIAIAIAFIGIFAFLGVNGMVTVVVSVVVITIFDCITIAAAIPLQMVSSIMLQTKVKEGMLGHVYAVISLISTIGVALGVGSGALFYIKKQ